MHSDWRLGEVTHAKVDKDDRIRTVQIKYSIIPEQEDEKSLVKTWKTGSVTRPVRQCVKLFHLEETSLISDIREALALVKRHLRE